jgi:hypothetical protein
MKYLIISISLILLLGCASKLSLTPNRSYFGNIIGNCYLYDDTPEKCEYLQCFYSDSTYISDFYSTVFAAKELGLREEGKWFTTDSLIVFNPLSEKVFNNTTINKNHKLPKQYFIKILHENGDTLWINDMNNKPYGLFIKTINRPI